MSIKKTISIIVISGMLIPLQLPPYLISEALADEPVSVASDPSAMVSDKAVAADTFETMVEASEDAVEIASLLATSGPVSPIAPTLTETAPSSTAMAFLAVDGDGKPLGPSEEADEEETVEAEEDLEPIPDPMFTSDEEDDTPIDPLIEPDEEDPPAEATEAEEAETETAEAPAAESEVEETPAEALPTELASVAPSSAVPSAAASALAPPPVVPVGIPSDPMAIAAAVAAAQAAAIAPVNDFVAAEWSWIFRGAAKSKINAQLNVIIGMVIPTGGTIAFSAPPVPAGNPLVTGKDLLVTINYPGGIVIQIKIHVNGDFSCPGENEISKSVTSNISNVVTQALIDGFNFLLQGLFSGFGTGTMPPAP